MTKKVTKEMQFNAIKEILEAQEQFALAEFIQNEIELVRKKNSRKPSDKPTKAQMENIRLMDAIANALEPEKAFTVSDILRTVPELNGMSNQKVSALARAMVTDGRLIRSEVKGKAFFTLA